MRWDARTHLERLVGQTIHTLSGRPNTILRVEGASVIVGTSRSPNGKPVPIKWAQDAMDQLSEQGELTIEVSTVGTAARSLAPFSRHFLTWSSWRARDA